MTFNFIANIDGAARGKNGKGESAWAFTIQHRDGKHYVDRAETMGSATNNVAEYTALIKLLDWALDEGITELHIKSDSQLMVRQVNGQYSCNHPALIPLWLTAKERLDKLKRWRLEWVRRENNKHADFLCNEVLDEVKHKPLDNFNKRGNNK